MTPPAHTSPLTLKQSVMTELCIEKADLLELQAAVLELKKLTLLGAKNALTMNDVCLVTGLSKSHVYKLVSWKKIPYYKSDGGKLTYFKKQDIENWQLAHRFSSNDELEQAALGCGGNEAVKAKKGGAR